MQWYVILISVATTGAFGWFALELVGRPIRNFFDLRRSVRHQMPFLANVAAPQPRETCVTSEQIRQYDTDLKNAREAQRILRDLASQMLAFAESERAACIAIRPFGFDPSSAGSGLIGLSNTLDRRGTDRAGGASGDRSTSGLEELPAIHGQSPCMVKRKANARTVNRSMPPCRGYRGSRCFGRAAGPSPDFRQRSRSASA